MTSYPKTANLERLIDALLQANVAFIVVGGAAAVLHGAPITTQDVDIVHDTDDANVDRLADVLKQLDTVVRDLAGRNLSPSRTAFAGSGQLNLLTSLGPLDVLCRLHDGRGYADLIAHSEVLTSGDVSIRVLDLATLIEVKRSTGRARDKLALPILIALQREPK